MATVVSIACGHRASDSAGDIMVGETPLLHETITSSAASQATTGTAPDDFSFWEITTKDGAVWVRFAANPTAAAGNDFLVPAGSTRWYEAVRGHKAAVIDA